MKRRHRSSSPSSASPPQTRLRFQGSEIAHSTQEGDPESQRHEGNVAVKSGTDDFMVFDVTMSNRTVYRSEGYITDGLPSSGKIKLRKDQYSIGWICALREELSALLLVLDEEHEHHWLPNDDNEYHFGRVGLHNVIISRLPVGRMGTVSAATTSVNMARSFPDIKCVLLVGIGGGIPNDEDEIRLGDVAISEPDNKWSGVVQFDMGTRDQNGSFKLKGYMDRPSGPLLKALSYFGCDLDKGINRTPEYLHEAQEQAGSRRHLYKFPGLEHDHLFPPDYKCISNGKSCTSCDRFQIDPRQVRPTRSLDPAIHRGIIASGNTLMRDPRQRDHLREQYNAICIEMEAAGLMNGGLPCIVIRGICDYADSHKNDIWHNYSSLTAAAAAKALLSYLRPTSVQQESSIYTSMKRYLQNGTTNSIYTNESDNFNSQSNAHPTKPFPTFDLLEMNKRHQYYLDKSLEGTWQSVLQDPVFTEWRHGNLETSNVLFCHGAPGVGKSCMMSLVVKSLESKRHKGCGLAFVYCRNGDSKQTSEALMSSLAAQLLVQVPVIRDKAVANSLLPTNELLEFAGSCCRHVYICIDAIDEMNAHERTKLLESLFGIKTSLRIFITGRSPVKGKIESQFATLKELQITASASDIEQCVRNRMLESPTEWIDMAKEISRNVNNVAQGNFLFADKLISFVLGSFTPREIQQRIKAIPESLDVIYSDMVARIQKESPRERDLANGILAWVSHSERPLNLRELQMAYSIERQIYSAIGNQSTHAPSLDHEDLVNQDMFRGLCQGLIEIDESDSTVHPFHLSFRDYLRISDIPDNDIRHTLFKDVQERLAKVCLVYLKHPRVVAYSVKKSAGVTEGIPESLDRYLDLLDYASCFWGTHTKKSSPNPSLMASATKFLLLGLHKRYASQWCLCRHISIAYKPPDLPSLVFSFSHLHVASYFGLERVAKEILSKSCIDINTRDCYGATALHWAAGRGCKNVVKVLLEAKANVNVREHSAIGGATALTRVIDWAAVKMENSDFQQGESSAALASAQANKIIKLLLKGGAMVNYSYSNHYEPAYIFMAILKKGHNIGDMVEKIINQEAISLPRHQTPLMRAAEIGALDIMQRLLKNEADVNLRAAKGWTALHWAVIRRKFDAISLLLNKKSDVSIRDKESRTALDLAQTMQLEEAIDIMSPHVKVAQASQAEGINDETSEVVSAIVNMGGVDHGQPLERVHPLLAASWLGEIEIIRSALKVSVKEGIVDGDGRTALSWAAGVGSVSVIKFLLNEGVSIHHLDKSGRTPLSWAAQGGHIEAAELLIKHGSSKNFLDTGTRSPLHWAVANKRTEMVKYLLRKGADPGKQDINGKTPLTCAAIGGSTETISLLLKANASLDHRDKVGRTPLSYAAGGGNDPCVQKLLNRGANVNYGDDHNKSPLLWAAGGGYFDIVKRLHEKGGDIGLLDRDGRTPLHWAAANGHLKVVKYLAMNGQNITRSDKVGRSALSWASTGAHERTIRYLLENGADPNSEDDNGRSPLSWLASDCDRINLYMRRFSPGVQTKGLGFIRKMTFKGDPSLLQDHDEAWSADKGSEVIEILRKDNPSKVLQILLNNKAKLDHTDHDGRTAVSLAAKSGQTQFLKSLLDFGANANLPDNMGRTPLSWASSSPKAVETMMLLLDVLPNCAIEAKDIAGRTPLSWAASIGDVFAVQELLSRGADPNVADKSGRLPLSWAVQRGASSVVKTFIKNGIYPHCEDTSGRTLLSYAAEGGDIEIFKQVLQQDLNPDMPDRCGRTPLSWVGSQPDGKSLRIRENSRPGEESWSLSINDTCLDGNADLVEALLEKDVDLESRDQGLRTPLSWAAGNGGLNIVKTLLESGANVNAKDRTGRIPLSYALESGREKIVKLLLDFGAITTTISGRPDESLVLWSIKSYRKSAVQELINHWKKLNLPVPVGRIHRPVCVAINERNFCGRCSKESLNVNYYSCQTCFLWRDSQEFTICVECFQQGLRCPGQHTMIERQVYLLPEDMEEK